MLVSVQNCFRHFVRGFRTWKVNKMNWRYLLCHLMRNHLKYLTVINSVRGLPSARHQRSPSDYIDSHTTQTGTCHPGLHFPYSISLITRSPVSNYTHSKDWSQTTIQHPVLFSIYHSPSDSYFMEPVLIFWFILVFCFLISCLSVDYSLALLCLDSVWPSPELLLVLSDYPSCQGLWIWFTDCRPTHALGILLVFPHL